MSVLLVWFVAVLAFAATDIFSETSAGIGSFSFTPFPYR